MSSGKRDFDKDAATWDENPMRVKIADDIANAILRRVDLTADMDILEFGCGTGLLSLRLQPLAHSITGVDNSSGMLEVFAGKVAKEALTNVAIRKLDLEKGDVLAGAFHLVVSSMTLHHIADVENLLRAFHRIVAPSGYLCIADLDSEDGEFHRDKSGVFHEGFDRPQLQNAFEKAGFRDVQAVTATELERPGASGPIRRFSIFLMSGRK